MHIAVLVSFQVYFLAAQLACYSEEKILDDFVNGLVDNWHLVDAWPLPFVVGAVLFFGLGYALAVFGYKKKRKAIKADAARIQDELAHLERVLADERDEYYFYRAEAGALRADIERMSAILAGENPLATDAHKSAIHKQIASKAKTSVLLCANFFNRQPEHSIMAAMKKAAVVHKLVFVIIYNPAHPTKSNLSYALGHFLQYQSTRKLVDKNFICVLVEGTDDMAKNLVPPDDALNNCRWVVLTAAGEVLRSESLSANPDEGLRMTRQVLEQVSALECSF